VTWLVASSLLEIHIRDVDEIFTGLTPDGREQDASLLEENLMAVKIPAREHLFVSCPRREGEMNGLKLISCALLSPDTALLFEIPSREVVKFPIEAMDV
jgi:hypothetical protein